MKYSMTGLRAIDQAGLGVAARALSLTWLRGKWVEAERAKSVVAAGAARSRWRRRHLPPKLRTSPEQSRSESLTWTFQASFPHRVPVVFVAHIAMDSGARPIRLVRKFCRIFSNN